MMLNQQQLEFFHLTEADGLSHNIAINVVQDRLGFIWINTFSGLNRFDGYEFKVFRHEPGNPNSLSDDMIRAMALDKKRNVLWLATKAGGLNKFDPLTETFTHYRGKLNNADGADKDFPTSTSAVYVDTLGFVWVGGNEELIQFEPETETFVRYQHDPNKLEALGQGLVQSICEDKSGQLWVANRGGGGLHRFIRNKQSFVHYSGDPDNPHGPGSYNVHTLYIDRSDTLWVTTEDRGFCYLDSKTQTFTRFEHDPHNPQSLSHNYVRDIIEDVEGNLWVVTLDGLNKMDRKSGRFIHYRHNPADSTTLSQDSLSRLFEDKMGGLWVSSDTGLNYCYPKQQQFTRYRHDFTNQNSLDDNVVRFIYEETPDLLWLGTLKGLNRFDRIHHQFKHFQHDPLNPNSLGQNVFVSTIVADADGKFWVGLWGGELNFFNPQTECFWPASQHPDTPIKQVINNVLTLHKDHNGHIWVGAYHQGLYHFNQAGQYINHYAHHPQDANSLSGHSIHCLYEDRQGILWVGMEDSGLDQFNIETETFTHYRYQAQEPGTLSSDRVHCIVEDEAGTLWVGTGNGLNRFDQATKNFRYYGPTYGMPAVTVYGIVAHKKTGHLWLSTVQGLVRFNPQTERFRIFDMTDASQNTFSQNAYYQNATGEMFFGGINGLTVFHPDEITLNANIPPVVITNFLCFNKPVPIGDNAPLKRAIWATDEITLSEHDYSFTLEFSALSYIAPQKNRYRYKLEGFDQDWHEVDSRRRYAAYSNLPAGTYTFRVLGSNNHGVWNEKGVSLKINIAQPLWEKLRLAKETAEAASQAKSNFLSVMSHELRTPLNAILGYAQILKQDPATPSRQQNSLDSIEQSGVHLLTLINDILDLAKIEAGQIILEANPFDLISFLEALITLMQASADLKGLAIQLKSDPILAQLESCNIEADERRLRQVLINLLGNALKFTNVGTITLGLNLVSPTTMTALQVASTLAIEFSIADTGPGIALSDQKTIFNPFQQTDKTQYRPDSTGLGLAISQELVTLMGGHIQVDSKPGQGSRFWFTLQCPLTTPVQLTSQKSTKKSYHQGPNNEAIDIEDIIPLPSSETLHDLLNLAELGDIEALESQLAASIQRAYPQFTQKILALSQNFQIEKIVIFLQACLQIKNN